jgi:glutathione S-transferase
MRRRPVLTPGTWQVFPHGEWLDHAGWTERAGVGPVLPAGDRALRLAVRLVDEHLDEAGLYMAHHNRWKVSARDNDAGRRLAAEQRPLLGPLAGGLGRWFAARQARRLPYLFSVAPEEARFDDLPARLRPPSRAGFPPTHALLEERFAVLLSILETLLAERAYLFGDRFTLADSPADRL